MGLLPQGEVMSSSFKYAYLKQQTYLYRRNYPRDLQPALGQALKQSLKTGDAKLAKARADEVNAKFEEIVAKARQGVMVADPKPVRVAPAVFPVGNPIIGRETVGDLAKQYLNQRSNVLRPGGFKSVRFSVGLLVSLYSPRQIGGLSRDDGTRFASLISKLSPHVGKSFANRRKGLEDLVRLSSGDTISVRTQKRILSQCQHFLDWAIFEGQLAENPFKSVRVIGKQKLASYASLNDEEVALLIDRGDPVIGPVMLFCLLTGMRAGEAVGLLREDLLDKGNLGTFAWIRPNRVRLLKTDAAERMVPLHSVLQDLLADLPGKGRLFPELSVPAITKRFTRLRRELGLERPGLVFHSTRKWFITQCERNGFPEHFTASLVGHQSARSENRLTYGIYSAGIDDEQKREIIDSIKLPERHP
jgi:integrase